MGTTARVMDSKGRVLCIRVSDGSPWLDGGTGYRFIVGAQTQTLSVAGYYTRAYERYSYVREQLELNEVRTGVNLVDEERTKHILEGEPIAQSVQATLFDAPVMTTSVSGWSGGHANPEAAKFGKTQIPEFWTTDRFMFEVSDVLVDPNTQWRRQEDASYFHASASGEGRYVCVEERYGVPIRVVADRVDDGFRCVTAFPDYGGAD
jgi:hypothetical protein